MGLAAAALARGSAAGAGWPVCGDSDNGALAREAFALPADGAEPIRGAAAADGVAAARAAGTGFVPAGVAEVTGVAAPSGWSPRTDRVLIFRGSLFGRVPFPAPARGGLTVATLAVDGGFGFGV